MQSPGNHSNIFNESLCLSNFCLDASQTYVYSEFPIIFGGAGFFFFFAFFFLRGINARRTFFRQCTCLVLWGSPLARRRCMPATSGPGATLPGPTLPPRGGDSRHCWPSSCLGRIIQLRVTFFEGIRLLDDDMSCFRQQLAMILP